MNKNNYHTHTARCYHASGKDEEYVKAAIQANIKELGFSDHTPWHYDSSFKASMRMPECQLDDYIESIRYLKEKYKDQISILIGLECEYFERYMPWLEKMLKDKQIDYILTTKNIKHDNYKIIDTRFDHKLCVAELTID